MRVITFNANGIRSAANKGFFKWLANQNADFVCLQETKAQEHQLLALKDTAKAELAIDLAEVEFYPKGYHCFYFDAEKKGYSGVAIYTKHEPDEVIKGLGITQFDKEGRYIQLNYGNFAIVSVYFPSGTMGPIRQEVKYQFLDFYRDHLEQQKKDQREYIIAGDLNIAHKTIDLKNWQANQKSTGFLPEERAWLDELFGKGGFVDGFRVVNQESDQYTWWSHRAFAWENNVGWRIDYQVLTPGLKDTVQNAFIYRDEKFSDHAPLVMDYDILI